MISYKGLGINLFKVESTPLIILSDISFELNPDSFDNANSLPTAPLLFLSSLPNSYAVNILLAASSGTHLSSKM